MAEIDEIVPVRWKKLREGEALEDYARRFPHMGGVKVGPELRQAASRVEPGRAIVEVGTWLGAGTAYLALGAPQGIPIHCYDRFRVRSAESEKARAFGVELPEDADSLPWVKKALKPFGAKIVWHQGELIGAIYGGPPIALYVDDANKRPDAWRAAVLTFKPFFIPGVTVLFLMDFYFYERMGSAYEAQPNYMRKHRAEFELLADHVGATSCAVFRYLGENAAYPIQPAKSAPRRTICEVLREIYRLAEERAEADVLALAQEAHDMAKRMDRKLHEYKEDWDRGFWRDDAKRRDVSLG